MGEALDVALSSEGRPYGRVPQKQGVRDASASAGRSSGGSDRASRAAALHQQVRSLDAEIADLQQAFATALP